jgi:hydroxyacylglutathione hydrolase
MRFQIIYAPGHSPGSVCLHWMDKNVLFTGDVVFDSGVGRTDIPGGDGQMLKESIKRISKLTIDYLLPGHGMPILERKRIKENFKDIEKKWFAYI